MRKCGLRIADLSAEASAQVECGLENGERITNHRPRKTVLAKRSHRARKGKAETMKRREIKDPKGEVVQGSRVHESADCGIAV